MMCVMSQAWENITCMKQSPLPLISPNYPQLVPNLKRKMDHFKTATRKNVKKKATNTDLTYSSSRIWNLL